MTPSKLCSLRWDKVGRRWTRDLVTKVIGTLPRHRVGFAKDRPTPVLVIASQLGLANSLLDSPVFFEANASSLPSVTTEAVGDDTDSTSE